MITYAKKLLKVNDEEAKIVPSKYEYTVKFVDTDKDFYDDSHSTGVLSYDNIWDIILSKKELENRSIDSITIKLL
ncbi:hypothetical protein DB321_09510 [Ligilactobacillus salivarius]|uniref:Uncharacterized protein n=1 Tax=Ligilactobacillus salivarius DSM 20555 = ATCC 11741 TaxID=1423799 RepID=C2EGZ5_9LACO|nr:hypothetical protein [Ligilactobacillus salivarius]EEJ74228.1 hypothetical protein HMPREF0545_0917 [Ligilactobacillus salivarius DSM 20555 = ATCC 11741]KRM68439.1 hypothetical protein FC55_GL001108 [Ligilactobacillus salivarius DSM 20555 = ATCC 11741]MDQ4443326.1 hypothetical protein [Ligilactobacillus salivarius]MDV9166945.1 hypothetical protein [Ligilactobacillus salivarius]NRD05197.1 hypothetical protein [Ligilactobacillus salivarius]